MKILVIGKGFIGSALIKRLKSERHKVSTYDIVDGQDILDKTKLDKAVKNKDLVYHLAAVADLNWARVHPLETMRINVEGCWNVADACVKSGAKLFYASTCCVYGNQERHPVNEDTLPNPAEIYACSKLAGEYVILGFHKMYGLDYNFMRFATIYGPGMRAALGVHIFLGQALRGEDITVHGDGKQTRTLTYIDDLISGIVALQNSGRINDKWNLTAEPEISAINMAKEVIRLTGRGKVVHVDQRPGQTFRESVSAMKMKEEVGWVAKVPLVHGLSKTYDWFIEKKQIDNLYEEPK